MKKIFKITFLFLVTLMIAGCGMNPVQKSVSEAVNREILFHHDDTKGDGYGPGFYTYPQLSEYKRNAYDLRSFTVEDAGDFIYLKFRFFEEIAKNTSYFGRFGQIIIDVYIDRDQQPYSGEIHTLPGRDVVFNQNQAWETMVLVNPLESEGVRYFLDNDYEDVRTKLLYKSGKIVVPDFYITGFDTITAKIPKKDIGEPKSWWGYQVLVMGFNENNRGKDNLFLMEARATTGIYNFGGGSAYFGNPNVLDILDNGDNINQKEILSDFSLNPERSMAKFPETPMIYGKKIEGVEKIDISINKSAQQFLKNRENVENKNKQENLNSDCKNNMALILEAAYLYRKEKPDDRNFTFFDLLLSGLVSDNIRCKDGGYYRLKHLEKGKIRIECIDLEGNILHGFAE
ncbi:MAG: glucodextranase DOMON-like domain-containing protein [Candidatus Muiribacteriota bacterium]|jgi:hypothetical protein